MTTKATKTAATIDEATLPAGYYDCRGFAERMAWMRRENRRRCDAAAARPADAEGFELSPAR